MKKSFIFLLLLAKSGDILATRITSENSSQSNGKKKPIVGIKSVPMRRSGDGAITHEQTKQLMKMMPINPSTKAAKCLGCSKWFCSFYYKLGYETTRGLHITNIKKHIEHCDQDRLKTKLREFELENEHKKERLAIDALTKLLKIKNQNQ